MSKKDQNIERRFFDVELRDGLESSAPHIDGYAAVFDSESELIWDFIEIIEPGFFDDVLDDDVRALFNHDRNYVMGRNGNGTLMIAQDAEGLKVEIIPPDTELINDLVIAPMQRGDINQMSFGFQIKPDGDDWEKRDDGVLVRRLKKGGCLRLHDVSIVTEPAYPETSAQVRAKISEFQSNENADAEHAAPGGAEADADAVAQAQVRARKLILVDIKKSQNDNKE